MRNLVFLQGTSFDARVAALVATKRFLSSVLQHEGFQEEGQLCKII